MRKLYRATMTDGSAFFIEARSKERAWDKAYDWYGVPHMRTVAKVKRVPN